jgi:polysaccharide export outer membrane protein
MGHRPEYRLGGGDSLHIVVYQNADLSIDARVSENGIVTYPLLGQLKLGGLTLSQAEQTIATGLKDGKFVNDPQVNVLVTQVRGNQASVLGQVGHPGRFPIEVAGMRLTDLLALAGGVNNPVSGGGGSDQLVLIGQRQGQPFRLEVDLPSLFTKAGAQADPIILDGDVLYVGRAPQIYISGEVNKPGELALERGMDVRQALAAGGGVTQRGTEKGLRIYRRDADGKPTVFQPGMDDALQNGDVVYVKESLF